MKTICRWFTLCVLNLLAVSAAVYAHGLHAPVAPQYHLLVHLLQLAGVVAVGVAVGLWARKRARR